MFMNFYFNLHIVYNKETMTYKKTQTLEIKIEDKFKIDYE